MYESGALAIGRNPEAERWIELSLAEGGNACITLVDLKVPRDLQPSFVCTLEHLRLVAMGMSYQISSSGGYLTISRSQDCLNIYARQTHDSKTWTLQVSIAEFRHAASELSARVKEENHGYAA